MPAPICQVTNPVHMDGGTMVRHRSPTRGPVCRFKLSRRHAPLQVDTLLFDEGSIVRFLDTVAHAKSLEYHLKVVWRDYDESTVINVIYSILPFFGKPGIVEVDTGDINQILTEKDKESLVLQDQFVSHLERGAKAVTSFLDAQEGIRRRCLETVQEVYRVAAELNEEMRMESQKSVVRLTHIKTASTIVEKALGLFGGGVPGFLLGQGYDLTLRYVKEWGHAPNAKLIGMASETWKGLANDGVKEAAEKVAEASEAEVKSAEDKTAWLRKRLEKMEKELQARSNAERLKKFAKDGRKLSRAEQEASHAKMASKIFSKVKFVFFAWDVYEALKEDHETLHEGANKD